MLVVKAQKRRGDPGKPNVEQSQESHSESWVSYQLMPRGHESNKAKLSSPDRLPRKHGKSSLGQNAAETSGFPAPGQRLLYASPLSRNRPPRYSTDKTHGLLPAKESAEQLKDTLNRSDKISQLILSSSMNQTIRNRNNMKQAAKKSLISSVAFSQQQRSPLHEDCARRVSLPNLRAADSSLQ